MITLLFVRCFRQREHELLAALEGVVQRCQELEAMEALRQASQTSSTSIPAPADQSSFFIPRTPQSTSGILSSTRKPSSRSTTPTSTFGRTKR